MNTEDKTTEDQEKIVAENTVGDSSVQNHEKEPEVVAENEEINGEEGRLLKLQEDILEAKDKYLRLYSEFENFKRRTAKEKLEMIQSANEQLLTAIIPVLDDFDRAAKTFEGEHTDEQKGFLLIQHKFKKIIEHYGVKEMELKAGDDFNTDFHEAVTQIPAPEEDLKGKVVDVIEKGYLLGEKVIRYAKVVVGN